MICGCKQNVQKKNFWLIESEKAGNQFANFWINQESFPIPPVIFLTFSHFEILKRKSLMYHSHTWIEWDLLSLNLQITPIISAQWKDNFLDGSSEHLWLQVCYYGPFLRLVSGQMLYFACILGAYYAYKNPECLPDQLEFGKCTLKTIGACLIAFIAFLKA